MRAIRTYKEEIVMLVAAGLLLLGAVVRAHAYPHYGHPEGRYEASISADVVYTELGGYGEWRYVPSVGVRLWFPFVEIGWRPYTYGHWIHTIDGLTWVAYEPWGYIPHHYGRWIYVDHYGWGWAPGYDYGPAWVTWGVSSGHIGWAPVPPVWYRYPHHVAYHAPPPIVEYRYGGYHHYPVFGIRFDLWVFVPDIHFYGVNVSVHVLPRERCVTFFRSRSVLPVGHTLHINYVRQKTRHPIATVPLDRVPSRTGGRSYVRPVPRGQEKKIREAEPAVSRVLLPPKRDATSGYRKSGSAPETRIGAPERRESSPALRTDVSSHRKATSDPRVRSSETKRSAPSATRPSRSSGETKSGGDSRGSGAKKKR